MGKKSWLPVDRSESEHLFKILVCVSVCVQFTERVFVCAPFYAQLFMRHLIECRSSLVGWANLCVCEFAVALSLCSHNEHSQVRPTQREKEEQSALVHTTLRTTTTTTQLVELQQQQQWLKAWCSLDALVGAEGWLIWCSFRCSSSSSSTLCTNTNSTSARLLTC